MLMASPLWASSLVIYIIVYLALTTGHLGYRVEVFSPLDKNIVNLQTRQLTQPVANTIGHHCTSWLGIIQYIGCTITRIPAIILVSCVYVVLIFIFINQLYRYLNVFFLGLSKPLRYRYSSAHKLTLLLLS